MSLRAVIIALFVSAVLAMPVLAAGPNTFVYKSQSGVAFTVTPQGLSTITVAGKVVARGEWHTASGESLFGLGSGEVKVGPVRSASLESTASDRATVTQVYQDIKTTFDYTFSGDIVEIKAKVENNHPDKGLWVTSFEGLTFDMPGNARMSAASDFYPSKTNPIGGAWATSAGYGVGMTPANPRLMRTLFSWGPAKKAGAKTLRYSISEIVPAQGARTYIMKMKVAATTDWKTLLQPYRDYFILTFGDVRFTADNRPVAVAAIKSSASDVTGDNPYGYSDRLHRFDKADVVKDYLECMLPAFKKANVQSLIFRGLAGYDSRGLEWMPYFNNLPPEIDDPAKPDADLILKQICTALGDSKINTGMTGQPNAFDQRVTWTKNEPVKLNPEDKNHMDQLWQHRIKDFLDRGVTTFNFENFGSTIEDVEIMEFLREKMGPDAQTFVSEPCDAMLLYSGAYVTANYDQTAKRYVLDMPQQTLDALRWLVPGSQFAIRYSQIDKDAAGESPVAWTYRNHMIPMLADTLIPAAADELATMEANYLNDKWQWLE